VKDPPDPQDFRLDSQKLKPVALPKTYLDLVGQMPPPQDQGDDNSCVAFACTYMKEFQDAKDRHVNAPLSQEYIFLEGLRLERRLKLPPKKSGITIRIAMKILQKQGVCLQSEWKYRPKDRDDGPAKQLSASARIHRIGSYASMKTCEEMRQAIFQLGPIVTGVPVFDTVRSKVVDRTGVVPDKWAGKYYGHALCFCGWDGSLYDGTGGFVFENSWTSFYHKTKLWAYGSKYRPGFGSVSYAYIDHFIQKGYHNSWRSTDLTWP
jgi:C1A family cysteine protease